MPITNGFEMADQIEKIRSNVKILLMSGYAGDYITRKFGVQSVREIVPKPFSKGALAARIEAVFGPGRAR